ncbi:MAG: hypothetical protein PWQ57_1728 [Desulfovibrionales bacterium]|nr:hypothetical protein [Desulfovibrionales bacterium]
MPQTKTKRFGLAILLSIGIGGAVFSWAMPSVDAANLI